MAIARLIFTVAMAGQVAMLPLAARKDAHMAQDQPASPARIVRKRVSIPEPLWQAAQRWRHARQIGQFHDAVCQIIEQALADAADETDRLRREQHARYRRVSGHVAG